MNMILASYEPQKIHELNRLTESNIQGLDRLSQTEKDKCVNVSNIIKDCSEYIELDEYQTNIYVCFVKYVTTMNKNKVLEDIMLKSLLSLKEVNVVSNSIRNITQIKDYSEMIRDFLEFSCADLDSNTVNGTIKNIIKFFTNSNNNAEIVGIFLLH